TLTHFETRKAAALLAYLAFYRERAHPREVLAEQLWPEEDLDATRDRFRQALSTLRQVLEPPGTPPGSVLFSDRTEVQLRPAAARTDVAEFDAARRPARQSSTPAERLPFLEAALGLYRGELLPGGYEEWILPERERLAEAYRNALGHLAAARAELGDLPGAID